MWYEEIHFTAIIYGVSLCILYPLKSSFVKDFAYCYYLLTRPTLVYENRKYLLQNQPTYKQMFNSHSLMYN